MSLHAAFADQRQSSYGSTSTVAQKRTVDAETDNNEPVERRIGVSSAIFMIVNRMIGAGIFVTPSIILAQSGSVGLSLLLWVIGGVFAMVGAQVYVIWGTALPVNGGEKNYLEYLFPQPKGLAVAMFAAYTVLIGHSAGNSIACAQYLFKALSISATSSYTDASDSLSLKLTASALITSTMLIHGFLPTLGVKLQSILGMLKAIVLAIVIGSGMIAFVRGPWDSTQTNPGRNHNFENIWEGTTSSATPICLALYSVLFGFSGFNQVNYALSDVKSPERTLRTASFMAVTLVLWLYLAANLAYLAAVPKEDIIGSGGAQLVAALLFRNVYGNGTMERILDGFVAMSAFGNVLSVVYAQALVTQQLGKDGILPASKLWASSYPMNAPLAGAVLYWLVCLPVIFGVSHKDAYQFVINVRAYPTAMISMIIAIGLISISRNTQKRPESASFPRLSTYTFLAALVFGLANIFLIAVPFIPPPPGREPYQDLPYWAHILGGWMILGIGAAWWVVWRRMMS